MDENLYDEFGNYIGPELEEEEDHQEEAPQSTWGEEEEELEQMDTEPSMALSTQIATGL
jgi:U5 small nuclear ribonucleoprotein component